MSNNKVILSTAYLPPIQYVAKLIAHSSVEIEVYESYAKQSYRNRCVILSCNGPLALSVPVVKVNGNNTLTKDIEIDYSTNWQKVHWKAIESAYRNSTYFDFLADVLSPFYSRKEELLINFNSILLREILNFIEVEKPFTFTKDYMKLYSSGFDDYRDKIHPKQQNQAVDNSFSPIRYYQVFGDKFDFQPNLSIIDLLFNEGLSTLDIVNQSIIRKPA